MGPNGAMSKLDTSIAEEIKDETHKLGGPTLKQTGAFRHTEYAKGFYKVSGLAATATNESISGSSVVAPDQNTNAGGYSEVERSNVLNSEKRSPLGPKLFGRVIN